MALGLFRSVFWIVLITFIAIVVWLSWRLQLRWWPAALLRIGIIFLVLLSGFSSQGSLVGQTIPPREVLIVDQSDSLPDEVRKDSQQEALAWRAAGQNRLVISYGLDADVILSESWPIVNERSSNLSGALDLAEILLGEIPGRVIVASDGIPSSIINVDKKVDNLAERGHLLDVVRLHPKVIENDLYTGHLWTPSGLWEHTSFGFVLPVYAPASGEAIIQIMVNDNDQEEHVVQLAAGENFVSLAANSGTSGILTIRTKTLWDSDGFLANNVSFASIEVFPAPRIMMVTQNVGIADDFREGLVNRGIQVDFYAPEDLPVDLDALEIYKGIIIHNVLAQELSSEQMLALEVFVSKLGRGLIFLGGHNSYTLGGYQGTPLEEILPVRLSPPERSQRTPVTFIMVLDRSGSMAGGRSDRFAPIDLTREAAIRTIESLRAEDYIGVLTFSGQTKWEVDIRQLGEGINLRLAQDAVSQIRASGGTLMYQALEEAVVTLAEASPTESLHILLMSDGVSGDGSPEEFENLAQIARSYGITISTISLGRESDLETMALIAEMGNGRFYEVLDPEDLPKIMISESKAAHSENMQLGWTNTLSGEDEHPILFGFSLSELPLLSGYNAVSSKVDKGAEDILVSASFHDPILAAWQVGLGRVIAWMGDIGEDWAEDWMGWARHGDFWINVIRYTLTDPSLGLAQVDISVTESTVILDLHIHTSAGVPVNLAHPEFSFVGNEGVVTTLTVHQVGPGKYHKEFTLPPVGAYRGVVSYMGPNGIEEVAAPFVVDYPREWQPVDSSLGLENLKKWADKTGGSLVKLSDEIEPSAEGEKITSDFDLSMITIIILVVSWPIEIAIRRQRMPWR